MRIEGGTFDLLVTGSPDNLLPNNVFQGLMG